MANLKRDNHYLPECYQKGFTNASGQVWVKFAGKEPEPRNPKSVGRKRSLYILKNEDGSETDRVEDWFAEEVETPFAALSQRITTEQEKFSEISGAELGILARFVASQLMRTMGHKESIEEQAGSPVDSNTFVRVMVKKTWRLMDEWIKNPPNFYFYTSLPHVADQFITGDSPVLVMHENYSPVWTPTAQPDAQYYQSGRHPQESETRLSTFAFTLHLCLSSRCRWASQTTAPNRGPSKCSIFQ